MTVEPLVYTIPELAKVLRTRRQVAYELVKSGRIPTVSFNGTRLVPKRAVERFLEQEAAGAQAVALRAVR